MITNGSKPLANTTTEQLLQSFLEYKSRVQMKNQNKNLVDRFVVFEISSLYATNCFRS